MIRLKEDETYISFDADGMATGPRDGVFRRDTCYLSRYAWALGEVVPLMTGMTGPTLVQHLARTGPDRAQTVGFHRRLTLRSDGFDDVWTIENSSDAEQEAELLLEVEGDFRDLFAALTARAGLPVPLVSHAAHASGERLAAKASDGLGMTVDLAFDPAPEGRLFRMVLAPGERRTVAVRLTLAADDDPVLEHGLPGYAEWRAPFRLPLPDSAHRKALARAVDDLRMLLLSTPHGPYPAAGMPWFVTIFGRDALITGMMLLRWHPEVLKAVLDLLAANQGTAVDPFREEEPGRILHEMRRGELSRTGRIPFGRYYGSVDATPLFVMALEAYVDATGDEQTLLRLQPAWTAALDWLAARQDREGGLITFAPSGSGLTVQSWKDSGDSMNHADGTAAEPPLSVAEVQGYAHAAFRAGARFQQRLGNSAAAAGLAARADRLQAAFHRRFWIERLSTYAMALDGQGAPLEVLSSDPGHLLWAGIVPDSIAPRLVATLMGDALWSGWGLRTLGTGHAAYNPVSYHNGSVWPHDTAIFALGLARYGFKAELRQVATALFDLATEQPAMQLPELLSGLPREEGLPPVDYTHGCRPQAWAAAALPILGWHLLSLQDEADR